MSDFWLWSAYIVGFVTAAIMLALVLYEKPVDVRTDDWHAQQHADDLKAIAQYYPTLLSTPAPKGCKKGFSR